MSAARPAVRGCLLAALTLGLADAGAQAEEALAETIGAWTVECQQTEAGGRECRLRNDEHGKPALEQTRLLSFTLQAGAHAAEGLVRVADLTLPPRLEVELAFAGEVIALAGVGRHGRLAARFALPEHELPSLAAADAIMVRFSDAQGQPQELAIPTAGLAAAFALAADFL